MSGSVTGEGILVVNGNVRWNGTPGFKGLIVVLGGSFDVRGGGAGGIPQGGSIVFLNATNPVPDEDGQLTFGPTTVDFSGGGTADYVYDCDALWAAYDLLPAGQTVWAPNCDRAQSGPPNPFWAGPTELTIVSWRENIGWREDGLQ